MVTLVLFQPFALGLGEAEAVIARAATAVNATELLADPPTVTTIDSEPMTAPLGTVATICVVVQLLAEAAAPPKVIALLPWLLPNPLPLIVTFFPIGCVVGLSEVMCGRTLKLIPLLPCVFTVTTTLPVVAAVGTVATTFVLLQLVTVPVVPLNVTVLLP
jgi:hypothetical protein